MPLQTRCISGRPAHSHRWPESDQHDIQNLKPELLPPPSGDGRLHYGRRGLTRVEKKDRIDINRSDRSTYLDQKSVLRTGATPEYVAHVQHHPRFGLTEPVEATVLRSVSDSYWD